VLMCAGCQALRSSRHRGRPTTLVEMHEPDQPAELLAHHDPAEPWLQWGCPLAGCGHRVVLPWDLEPHAAAEHPGWVARFEVVRPYPNQELRVVFRRADNSAG
jgi:hypothetical protein